MVEVVGSERAFLGWDRMPLEASTEWLVRELGPDMSRVLVALPGARAGRLLLERLALACGRGLSPPRIVTAGVLSDELLEPAGRPAGRLARTLAWARALRSLDPHRLEDLVARPPEREDQRAWWRLAEEVRGLFGELAAEGLDFARVAQDELLADQAGERRRWVALAAAQEAMVARLADAGLTDPHLGRLAAIEAQRVTPVEHVVLVGVVEVNALLRKTLALTPARRTTLVFAPEQLSDSFDSLGCLVPELWSQRDSGLDLDHWRVADRPRDQAEAAVEEIASWDARYSAAQITIGIANTDVDPFVQRRLAENDIGARDAAGTPLAQTGPVALLELTARFLRSRGFGDFATLVRHEAFEAALRARTQKLDPVASVDEYFLAHLPSRVDGTWLARESGRDTEHDRALQRRMQVLWGTSSKLLDDLWKSGDRSLSKTTASLRRFLEAIYGESALDRANESQRVTLIALERIGAILAEIEELPEAVAPQASPDQAIELLLRMLKGEPVPPSAARAGEETIELLGWFELPLDDAPALVVLGFEDGHVPESVRGDAFLPNRLRRSLGLVDDERRLARDLYATELLLHSRERVLFVSGRRSLDGDPLVPSRIVFHCPQEEVTGKIKQFVGAQTRPVPRIQDQNPGFDLPRAPGKFDLESISVTDFKTYLGSPYLYYLTRVLKLETLDDRARELDPLAFGNLAHEVLERFGRDTKVRDSQDESTITSYLAGELESLASETYGQHPLPAVRLQLRQLEYRLARFAQVQAERRRAGWRVHAVEWAPSSGSVPFIVDGEAVKLRGRIDRIDHRPETGEFAVWDYKTGEQLAKPLLSHRAGDGTWRDLQLPLYSWLVTELCGESLPAEMGYVSLCRDTHALGFQKVATWGRSKAEFDSLEEGIESAWEVAQDVVRKIRRQEFFVDDGFHPSAPILQAIGGLGLVEGLEEEVAE